MTIALATPALTPAILPDLKTMVGSNGTPKNNPQAGDLVSHPSDYFSLPRLLEADEEQLGKGALTPGGLDSNTDASSSYSSSLYPPPSPRRASPAPASNDGLSRDDKAPLTDSPAASWTSNTTSSSAVQPNSANIFSRFRSLGRGQKRRNSQDPTAPPVISNPIPYREDGDRAEQDGQRQLLIEKIKAQQAQMVQAILSQPFEPCGTLDAPKLTLPPETTILISEQEPESGTWEVSYRGLVATTDLDSEILMDVLPGWLLNFLLGNRVSTREGSSAVKVTFVLQPEGGSEAAGLPELPNG
jgi:WD repeat-containing protein 48